MRLKSGQLVRKPAPKGDDRNRSQPWNISRMTGSPGMTATGPFTSFLPFRRVRFAPTGHSANARVYEYTLRYGTGSRNARRVLPVVSMMPKITHGPPTITMSASLRKRREVPGRGSLGRPPLGRQQLGPILGAPVLRHAFCVLPALRYSAWEAARCGWRPDHR
jgi:hypothetical protein